MSAGKLAPPPLRFLLKCSIYICNHHYIYRHHQSRCRIWWRFRFRAQTWAESSPRVSFWTKKAFLVHKGCFPTVRMRKKVPVRVPTELRFHLPTMFDCTVAHTKMCCVPPAPHLLTPEPSTACHVPSHVKMNVLSMVGSLRSAIPSVRCGPSF